MSSCPCDYGICDECGFNCGETQEVSMSQTGQDENGGQWVENFMNKFTKTY